MHHLEAMPVVARRGHHGGQPLRLQVVESVLGIIAVHQMRHDPVHPHRVLGLGSEQRGEHRRIVGGPDPVAIQSGVRLDGDRRGATGAPGRGDDVVDLTFAGHRHLDVGQQCGREIGVRGVQPRQYGRGDAGCTQGQRLLDGCDTKLGGARGQCGPRHRDGAVAVAVGLHHGHHRSWACAFAQHRHIVGDRAEVD